MPAAPIIGTFRARKHEKQCRRYFGERFVIPKHVEAIEAPVNIMVFVNRSGSSMIAEHLEATGKFSAFGEPLSSEMIIERAGTLGLGSFEEYLRWLFREIHGPGRQAGMKASLDQVLMLLRSGAIPRLFADVRWIFVERLDVLSQAISFCIATQTGQYYSHQAANGATPRYSFRTIKRRAQLLSRNYAECRMLMSFAGIHPYHVTYEQFLGAPEAETAKLAASLGEHDVQVETAKLRLERQADDINRSFRERFRTDFAASIIPG